MTERYFFKPETKKQERKYNGMEQAGREIREFFDAFDDGQERVNAIISRIVEPFSVAGLIDGDRIRRSLGECSSVKEREEFTEKVLAALQPLIELRKNNPEVFDEIERRALTLLDQERININEVLSYGISGNIIHIHFVPVGRFGIGELRKFAREGLEELARIVRGNEDIKKITATSWIVARHPKLMENLGFTVEGEINGISRAVMPREEFLAKYLRLRDRYQ